MGEKGGLAGVTKQNQARFSGYADILSLSAVKLQSFHKESLRDALCLL